MFVLGERMQSCQKLYSNFHDKNCRCNFCVVRSPSRTENDSLGLEPLPRNSEYQNCVRSTMMSPYDPDERIVFSPDRGVEQTSNCAPPFGGDSKTSNSSSAHAPARYTTAHSPMYSPVSPAYDPRSPGYTPASPSYSELSYLSVV